MLMCLTVFRPLPPPITPLPDVISLLLSWGLVTGSYDIAGVQCTKKTRSCDSGWSSWGYWRYWKGYLVTNGYPWPRSSCDWSLWTGQCPTQCKVDESGSQENTLDDAQKQLVSYLSLFLPRKGTQAKGYLHSATHTMLRILPPWFIGM